MCFEKRDGQAARHRVKRCARANDATADDEKVELFFTHFFEHGFAISRSELS
jgi:hypothetical protein